MTSVEPDQPPVEVLIARARERAPEAHQPWYPTLPTSTSVPVVHLTTDQLHDLVYAACSTYLHSLSKMPKDRARQHAERVATLAEQVAHNEGYVEQGQAR